MATNTNHIASEVQMFDQWQEDMDYEMNARYDDVRERYHREIEDLRNEALMEEEYAMFLQERSEALMDVVRLEQMGRFADADALRSEMGVLS